jgi:hypothetical protein
MEFIKLKPGKYYLQKEGCDYSGDSGPRFLSLKETEEGLKRLGESGEVHVGCHIQCGSINGRSYSSQDYWTTTKVTEIIEAAEDNSWVRFKTKNSTYVAGILGSKPPS